jgi:hypothetical protein
MDRAERQHRRVLGHPDDEAWCASKKEDGEIAAVLCWRKQDVSLPSGADCHFSQPVQTQWVTLVSTAKSVGTRSALKPRRRRTKSPRAQTRVPTAGFTHKSDTGRMDRRGVLQCDAAPGRQSSKYHRWNSGPGCWRTGGCKGLAGVGPCCQAAVQASDGCERDASDGRLRVRRRQVVHNRPRTE